MKRLYESLKEQEELDKIKLIKMIENDYNLLLILQKSIYKDEDTTINIKFNRCTKQCKLYENINDIGIKKSNINEIFSNTDINNFIIFLKKYYSLYKNYIEYIAPLTILNIFEYKIVMEIVENKQNIILETIEHYIPNESSYYNFCTKIKDTYLRTLFSTGNFKLNGVNIIKEFNNYLRIFKLGQNKNETEYFYYLIDLVNNIRTSYKYNMLTKDCEINQDNYNLFKIIYDYTPNNIQRRNDFQIIKLLIDERVLIKKN